MLGNLFGSPGELRELYWLTHCLSITSIAASLISVAVPCVAPAASYIAPASSILIDPYLENDLPPI